MMEAVLPNILIDTLAVSVVFSIIVMVLIQKLKSMSIVTKPWHICIVNILCSFGLGIPFTMNFYDLSTVYAVWVGILTFIGAPSIYAALKSQQIINFKPNSLTDYIEVPKENEIIREKAGE